MRRFIKLFLSLLICICVWLPWVGKCVKISRQVLQTDEITLSGGAIYIDYHFDIQTFSEAHVESVANPMREIIFLGKPYRVAYQETITYQLGDPEECKYWVCGLTGNGREDPYVLLNKKTDAVMAVVDVNFAHITLSEKDNNDDILDKIEAVMEGQVDFSVYGSRKLTSFRKGYDAVWRQYICGCLGDFLRISVDEEGNVDFFSRSTACDAFPADYKLPLSEQEIQAMLDAKLHFIYDTWTTRLKWYREYERSLTTYQGKKALKVNFELDFKAPKDGWAEDGIVHELCGLVILLE